MKKIKDGRIKNGRTRFTLDLSPLQVFQVNATYHMDTEGFTFIIKYYRGLLCLPCKLYFVVWLFHMHVKTTYIQAHYYMDNSPQTVFFFWVQIEPSANF